MPYPRFLERNLLPSDAMLRLILILLCLLLSACAKPPAGLPAAMVSGKVTDHQQPAAGVQVMAFPLGVASLASPAPFRSSPSGGDGQYRLALPAGDYYLLAQGAGHFSWYGRNPVTVPGEGLTDLNLGLVPAAAPAPPAGSNTLTGLVLHDGEPLAGAMIFIYTDLNSQLKGMGYQMAGPTGADGIFEAQLAPGTFYLLARLRQGDGGLGPLRPGDFIGYYPGNPVRLREGGTLAVTIPMLEVPENVSRRAERLFGGTTIQGRIVDGQGKPVAGAHAVLYDDPQMFNRPLFVSAPTTTDGRYQLSFPQGGTYFLAARDSLGGAPGPGDLYGTYDVDGDGALVIVTGQGLDGIDIMVEEMW
jgi:hypothetical protein